MVSMPWHVMLGSLLAAWAGLAPVMGGQPADPDEKILRDGSVATDGPGLLTFFRERTLTPERRAELDRLIRQLGSPSYKERQEATRKLPRRGRLALPLLRKALASSDIEVVRRAQQCIEKIEQGPGAGLPQAAVRLLVRRKPAGAVVVLLRFLPSADDELLEEEIAAALATLGVHNGKADRELTAALADPEPVRRAAAASVIGRLPDARQRALVRPLFEDRDPQVRFQAAQAFFMARDRAALPALVELLRDAPLAVAWRAEALLLAVAGERAPEGTPGTSAGERKKWHDAWAGWWRDHGSKLEIPKLDEVQPARGLTLVAEGHQSNSVWEYGRDGKERWTLTDVRYPMDLRPLQAGRVLVAECDAHRVTERDSKGQVLWEQKVTGNPLACQRLPSGNTLIATHQSIAEFTRKGKEVFSLGTGGDTLCDALKLPTGRVLWVNTRGELREITVPAGREVKKIELARRATVGTDWYHLEPLPGGRLLVASHSDGRVLEVDGGGRILWQCTVAQAYSATRLANGNTLVGRAEGCELVEVDRKGKTVHKRRLKGYLCRVRHY
jgi:hypothetical protein